MTLFDQITQKTATVGVVGLGYVGLPLAVEKAKAGFSVLGFDIQTDKVDRVNRGENYIGDVVPEELARLASSGKLAATADFARIASCDVVALCVPTPLDSFKQPDLSFVRASAESVARYAHPGMLVLLESTTYPGTTEEVVRPIFEKRGFTVGKDLFLAFSPERVDPGNARFKTKNTPKVVGGCTPECTRHAQALYEAVLEAPVFPVRSPKEAEMTKILENTFRIVNCALANEMAVICHKMGIDVWEVIAAAATKPFGFVPFYPGPGVGGTASPSIPTTSPTGLGRRTTTPDSSSWRGTSTTKCPPTWSRGFRTFSTTRPSPSRVPASSSWGWPTRETSRISENPRPSRFGNTWRRRESRWSPWTPTAPPFGGAGRSAPPKN